MLALGVGKAEADAIDDNIRDIRRRESVSATSDVREEYDPEMVAALLKADAEKPEATFTNDIDMMKWLECN